MLFFLAVVVFLILAKGSAILAIIDNMSIAERVILIVVFLFVILLQPLRTHKENYTDFHDPFQR